MEHRRRRNDKQYGGTGLGLSLVQSPCRRHGGKFPVKSSLGGSDLFSLPETRNSTELRRKMRRFRSRAAPAAETYTSDAYEHRAARVALQNHGALAAAMQKRTYVTRRTPQCDAPCVNQRVKQRRCGRIATQQLCNLPERVII
jgi:hypothetical protein